MVIEREKGLPVDGADGGYVVLVAGAISEQPVPDLPGEHGGILLLVVGRIPLRLPPTSINYVIECVRRVYLLMELTEGMLSWSQTPTASSLSLISQANMVGFCFL
ncbi:hypothetical protein JTE90_013046 [Oedothorax gibbosus]|uniref:Uncharacterized protein n=1 Tax=Oedothorax gibbosus TaxID=931172 RepID=A0AAV6UGR3_9ARAC|nr:hypothetical protein JTE90_013046 [Oedothorax gibbosus]